MKRATLAAFALGLLIGMGCGAAKVLPGPTTILVKVHLIASQNIDQLFVTGTVNGFDEFPRTYLPPDAGAPFNGPQSFRIFLADSEDGKNVEIDVFGLAEGTPVAAGTATVTVLKQHEVEADIDLPPSNDGGSGGGAGGGAGGGGVGGGVGGGGGANNCGCDGGCCAPGTTACANPKQITLQRLMGAGTNGSFVATDCGAPSQTCSDLCDPLRGICNSGHCLCGNSLCKAGQRCAVSGTPPNLSFACKCDQFSDCQGCCAGDSCVPPNGEDAGVCGNSGNQCQSCNSGAVSGCGGGVCTGTACGTDKCASGGECNDIQFPTCAAPATANNRCAACDVLRSNHCSTLAGFSTDGCACGSKPQCPVGQYCDDSSTCQPLL